MFNCWNATSPPTMTAMNRPTIMNRRLTAKETRRSISGHSGAGSRTVDEQAALDDHLLARLQIAADPDKVAVGQAGLDFAKLERLVVIGDPQPHVLALIDQRLLFHADRFMVAAGIDRDAGEHLRLEQPLFVVQRRADHQPAGRRVDRWRDLV